MLPLLPVVVLAAQVALHWDYTSTGVSTVECYARTLVGGGGLALQRGAIISSGFGSLIWVLLLAGAALVGLPIMTTAKLLGALFAAAALYLLPGIPRRLNGRARPRLVDLLPSLLLAIHPAVVLHAAGGLETSLTLLLLVVALRLYVREERAFAAGEPASCLGSLLPMLLLLLTGAEAPAWLGALMLGRALARAAGRRLGRWTLLWYALPLAAYALYLLWSYLTFADPWPATVTARLLDAADPAAVGWASLRPLYRQWGLTLPLLVVALVGTLRQTNYWARVALAGLGVASVAAVAATGGDTELGRRALPAALALVILAAEGIGLVVDRLRGRYAWWIPAAVVVGLLAQPLALGWRTAVERRPSPLHQQLAVAAALEQGIHAVGRIPAQVRVLTSAPGAFALHGFRVVDYSGVTDPAIRRYRRQPRELRHLIFQDRRPNVLVQPHVSRRASQAILHFPEAGREFVVTTPALPYKVDIGYSRRLLLERTPWGPPRPRRRVDQDLWLLGLRPLADHQLLLLWMSPRNSPPQREVELGLGAWSARITVGPPVYPMTRWRAGEIVRQVITIPPLSGARAASWVQLGATGERVACGPVDLELLRLDRPRWQRHHIKRVVATQGWEGLERLLMLWQDPTVSGGLLERHVAPKIRELVDHGLTALAAKQLAQARAGRSNLTLLDGLAEELAERTYQRALRHIRQSRWSLAEADLRAAARIRPSSPWIHRRLEQAQKRMPEGDYLIRALELEIAQRALALDPGVGERLARVMRAHLALGEPWAAVLAYHGWTRATGLEPGPTDRTRYLLAKALAAVGRLQLAVDMARRLVTGLRRQPHDRRCPPWSAIQPLALLVRVGRLLGQPVDIEPWLAFRGKARRLARGTTLVAHCVRWSAGRPVEVVLYLRQERGAPRELPLELVVGERRQRLVLTQRGGTNPLRRVVARMLVPPAAYPVRLHVGKTEVALGQLTVGPEANFGFELRRFSPWKVQGEAFGPGPVVARSPRWHVIYGHVGERYVDSYATGSDRPTGRLISPPFQLRQDHLMVLLAGGDHASLGLDLVLDQGPTITVRGNRSMILRPVFIPVARFRGRWARVVIRDESSAHWGYLAVDEIRQLDGPAPGVAP